jgi:amidohydrolase
MASFALHTMDISDSTAGEPVRVLQEVFDLFEEAKTHRRWFHAHPELSFEEFKTAAQIREILTSYGITELHENIGKTGIVAMIRGGAGEGPCIALRADMDGLPIQETADIEFRSQNANCMHACGHDGHITGLLIAAKILNQTKDQLKGRVHNICFFPPNGPKVVL